MGTDIHGFVQSRYNESRYQNVAEIESGRNYRVFAMLAGVRNGFGFAGVKTHEPLIPISEPRGLPSDLGLSFWPKVENCEDDFGGHSFSWLTLSEIRDWPYWDAPLAMTGVLERAEYERMQKTGGAEPEAWSGGVSGPGVIITTHKDVVYGDAPENWTHIQWNWTVPFNQYARTFKLWIDYLCSKYGWIIDKDPAAIRLVFGFDS